MILHRLLVKLQRALIEPARPVFLVVMKRKPDVFEFTDLRIVIAPAKVYDVSYSEGPQLLHMCFGFDCASKREPLAYKKGLQRYNLPPSVHETA